MSFQYLVTTVKKTQEQIKDFLDSTGICGSFIVGNQLVNENREYTIKTGKYSALVIDMTSRGVSLNRNTILRRATADYVTFLDDDMYLDSVCNQREMEKAVAGLGAACVRYNVLSDNPNRPVPVLSNEGYVSFGKLRAYGVCGGFYQRNILLDNNLLFDEHMGPGTDINHGEDTVFNHAFAKIFKIYQAPQVAFHAKQSESTWRGNNRDIKNDIIANGYIYKSMFGNMALPYGIYHLIKHRNLYNSFTLLQCIKIFKDGMKKANQ